MKPPALLLAVAFAFVAAVAVPGCGGDGRAAPPVDPEKARRTLRAALDHWKSGQTPESLRQANPPVVVQDFDWMAQWKLLQYEILGEGRDDDANLRVPVRLTLADPAGREVAKEVSYVVGTAPALTVFREMPQ